MNTPTINKFVNTAPKPCDTSKGDGQALSHLVELNHWACDKYNSLQAQRSNVGNLFRADIDEELKDTDAIIRSTEIIASVMLGKDMKQTQAFFENMRRQKLGL